LNNQVHFCGDEPHIVAVHYYTDIVTSTIHTGFQHSNRWRVRLKSKILSVVKKIAYIGVKLRAKQWFSLFSASYSYFTRVKSVTWQLQQLAKPYELFRFFFF